MGQWQGQVHRLKLLRTFAANTFLLLTETNAVDWRTPNESWINKQLKQNCNVILQHESRNLIKIEFCVFRNMKSIIGSLQPWQGEQEHYTAAWVAVSVAWYITLNTHLCTLDFNWFVWQYLNSLQIINSTHYYTLKSHYYSQQKLICDGLFWKEG